MPDQSHLFVGVPINSPVELRALAKRLGVSHTGSIYDVAHALWNAQSALTVEGQTERAGFHCQSSEVLGFNYLYRNTKTGAIGDSYCLFGVQLTSRYSPAIVDEGWDQGGRSEPFVLDLERLAKIKAEVAEQLPGAEILMLTLEH